YSPWIRVVQPHGGSGKGFYFIPEIDEEVMVSFENQNAERPYVIGSHYNGKSKSGYATKDNSIKVIQTRSGHIVKFTEDESIIITDKSGNEIHLDTTGGNINITAPETINISAKNINITASQNVSTSAGMSITETAGVNHSSTAGGAMMQSAVLDYSLVAANITEIAQGNRESKAKEIIDLSAKKNIHSEEGNNIHTKGTFNNNSGEKSNFH
ncbi:phage baseplate assembly protein V, partial [Bergeyella sp. RCAD1439]|uniref:phage baseplate assembly protein V n=1 Tax=Bergeyella anatis TaxID=3113737 RepID=UPI002E181168|nr:phage baseplate assembly protein V [Bergeyella sp. RCAD1439]